ncbi:uncharacterized protein LOC113351667 [Papaver somniferum]|uniref:uncharacterized protein LOC113351667 n=1 Tax=Papaver somniferum TaxID=3469 RepID=UPI000E6FFC3F|nr:uncharacterized protein LOC113351667 [Papaver somniferum]
MVDVILNPWIGNTLEVYIDNMLVKSKLRKDHHQDLRDIFEAIRKHHMKVNPEICTFGVTSGKFLGYLVTKRGIEVDPAKIQAIVEMSSPKNLKEVQNLKGSLTALAPLEEVLKSAGKVGRIAKWNTHLDQFNIIHEIQHSQKSQVLEDFLADLPLDNHEEVRGILEVNEGKYPVDILDPSNQRRWEVFVDVPKNTEGAGISIVITTPTGERIVHALRLEFKGNTNNIVEYEVVVHALRLIIEMGITDVRLTSDSQLVIRQIGLEYNVYDETLSAYMDLAQTLASQIPTIKFRHLGRKELRHADALAYISSMLRYEGIKAIKITRVYEPSVIPQKSFAANRKDDVGEDIADNDVGEDIADDFHEDDIMTRANEDKYFKNEEDWRTEFHLFLKEGTLPADFKQARKVQSKVGRYNLRDGISCKKSFLGPLLHCLSREEGHRVLKDIYYGDAGNHSGMRSLADKAKMQGYYWPTMIRDAARMSRRCEECRRFAKRIHAPATKLNSVDSPWPFSKSGIDIVGLLIEGSGKIRFFIVDTYYFSKWVEAKALSRIHDSDVFTFIFQNIICRFGIPEIVSDNCKQLQGKNIYMLFDTFKIRKNKSTPIYPQRNGKAEATNKTLAIILKKQLD